MSTLVCYDRQEVIEFIFFDLQQGGKKHKSIPAGFVMQEKFIAHHRKANDKTQLVQKHLVTVSTVCGELAGKIGIALGLGLLEKINDLCTGRVNCL